MHVKMYYKGKGVAVGVHPANVEKKLASGWTEKVTKVAKPKTVKKEVK